MAVPAPARTEGRIGHVRIRPGSLPPFLRLHRELPLVLVELEDAVPPDCGQGRFKEPRGYHPMVNGMKEAELRELVKGISSADLKSEVKKRGSHPA